MAIIALTLERSAGKMAAGGALTGLAQACEKHHKMALPQQVFFFLL